MVKENLLSTSTYAGFLVYDGEYQFEQPRKSWTWFNNYLGQLPGFMHDINSDSSNFWDRLSALISTLENVECNLSTTTTSTTELLSSTTLPITTATILTTESTEVSKVTSEPSTTTTAEPTTTTTESTYAATMNTESRSPTTIESNTVADSTDEPEFDHVPIRAQTTIATRAAMTEFW